MTAREEFNRMLNASPNPRATYNALSAFVTGMNSQTTNSPREALLEAVEEGEAHERYAIDP